MNLEAEYYRKATEAFERKDYKYCVILLKKLDHTDYQNVSLLVSCCYDYWKFNVNNRIADNAVVVSTKEAFKKMILNPNISTRAYDFIRFTHLYFAEGSLDEALKILKFASTRGLLEDSLIVLQSWTIMRRISNEKEANKTMTFLVSEIIVHANKRKRSQLSSAAGSRAQSPNSRAVTPAIKTNRTSGSSSRAVTPYSRGRNATSVEPSCISDTVTLAYTENESNDDSSIPKYVSDSDLPLTFLYLHCASFEYRQALAHINTGTIYKKHINQFTAVLSEAYYIETGTVNENRASLGIWFNNARMWLDMGRYLEGLPYVLLLQDSYWEAFLRTPLDDTPLILLIDSMMKHNRRQDVPALCGNAMEVNPWNIYCRNTLTAFEIELVASPSQRQWTMLFLSEQKEATKIQSVVRGWRFRLHWGEGAKQILLARRDQYRSRIKTAEDRYHQVWQHYQGDLIQRWKSYVDQWIVLQNQCALRIQSRWRGSSWIAWYKLRMKKIYYANTMELVAYQKHYDYTRLMHLQQWHAVYLEAMRRKSANVLSKTLILSQYIRTLRKGLHRVSRSLAIHRKIVFAHMWRYWRLRWKRRVRNHARITIRFFVRRSYTRKERIEEAIQTKIKEERVDALVQSVVLKKNEYPLKKQTWKQWRALYHMVTNKRAVETIATVLPRIYRRIQARALLRSKRLRVECQQAYSLKMKYRHLAKRFLPWKRLTAIFRMQRWFRCYKARQQKCQLQYVVNECMKMRYRRKIKQYQRIFWRLEKFIYLQHREQIRSAIKIARFFRKITLRNLIWRICMHKIQTLRLLTSCHLMYLRKHFRKLARVTVFITKAIVMNKMLRSFNSGLYRDYFYVWTRLIQAQSLVNHWVERKIYNRIENNYWQGAYNSVAITSSASPTVTDIANNTDTGNNVDIGEDSSGADTTEDCVFITRQSDVSNKDDDSDDDDDNSDTCSVNSSRRNSTKSNNHNKSLLNINKQSRGGNVNSVVIAITSPPSPNMISTTAATTITGKTALYPSFVQPTEEEESQRNQILFTNCAAYEACFKPWEVMISSQPVVLLSLLQVYQLKAFKAWMASYRLKQRYSRGTVSKQAEHIMSRVMLRLNDRHNAVVVLQSALRGYLGRKQYHSWKANYRRVDELEWILKSKRLPRAIRAMKILSAQLRESRKILQCFGRKILSRCTVQRQMKYLLRLQSAERLLSTSISMQRTLVSKYMHRIQIHYCNRMYLLLLQDQHHHNDNNKNNVTKWNKKRKNSIKELSLTQQQQKHRQQYVGKEGNKIRSDLQSSLLLDNQMNNNIKEEELDDDCDINLGDNDNNNNNNNNIPLRVKNKLQKEAAELLLSKSMTLLLNNNNNNNNNNNSYNKKSLNKTTTMISSQSEKNSHNILTISSSGITSREKYNDTTGDNNNHKHAISLATNRFKTKQQRQLEEAQSMINIWHDRPSFRSEECQKHLYRIQQYGVFVYDVRNTALTKEEIVFCLQSAEAVYCHMPQKSALKLISMHFIGHKIALIGGSLSQDTVSSVLTNIMKREVVLYHHHCYPEDEKLNTVKNDFDSIATLNGINNSLPIHSVNERGNKPISKTLLSTVSLPITTTAMLPTIATTRALLQQQIQQKQQALLLQQLQVQQQQQIQQQVLYHQEHQQYCVPIELHLSSVRMGIAARLSLIHAIMDDCHHILTSTSKTMLDNETKLPTLLTYCNNNFNNNDDNNFSHDDIKNSSGTDINNNSANNDKIYPPTALSSSSLSSVRELSVDSDTLGMMGVAVLLRALQNNTVLQGLIINCAAFSDVEVTIPAVFGNCILALSTNTTLQYIRFYGAVLPVYVIQCIRASIRIKEEQQTGGKRSRIKAGFLGLTSIEFNVMASDAIAVAAAEDVVREAKLRAMYQPSNGLSVTVVYR